MCSYGISFVCLQKLCLLSHQHTEVLTFSGQSSANITYFLAVCLTCCHTAASFPNPEEEVGSFDWLIHYWLWWIKDSLGGKSWNWVAPQGVIEQLFRSVHTTASAASPVNKTMSWTKIHEPERWNPSPDTSVGKQRIFWCSSLIVCNGQEEANGILQPPQQGQHCPRADSVFPESKESTQSLGHKHFQAQVHFQS